MSTRGRIVAVLRGRSVLVAVGLVPFIALLVFYMVTHRGWQDQVRTLERENLSLQLKQLASNIERECDDLEAAARTLAESDGAVDQVQDAPNPIAHFDMKAAARLDVGALVIATAAQTIRMSGTVANGQFTERTPDPAVLKYLSAASALSAGGVAFARDQLIAVHPIRARNSTAILGWLAAIRSMSPEMLARIQESVGGTVIARPIAQFLLPQAPPDIRSWLISSSADRSEVGTRTSGDGSGYAVIRDVSGRASWVFRLIPELRGVPAGAIETDAAGTAGIGGLPVPLAAFIALLAAVVAACVIIASKRYFLHRRSVDSRYKAIIDQTNDGIVIVDAAGHRVQYCNPAFLARIGYTLAEAEALTLSDIFVDAESTPESVLARLKEADSQMALNLQLRGKTGALTDVEVRCNRLDADGRDGLAYVTHDVSVRRKAEAQLIDNQQRLDKMAHHDQLTGLPNRHYLATFLPEAIAVAKASNSMLGVVFLDLDRFKHINDTRGHETGDKLLQEVARRLRGCVRDSDVVIRMGGDEFVVVFRNVTSYDEVTLGANRVIETLSKPIVIDQHPLQTTGSVGVSLFPRDGADMGELLKHSDTAMYQAKDRGRNNVQMFSQIMNRKLKHRVAMEASLRDALRLKQLDVHYQPFVNLLTRKVVGLEALIRWRHPVHGMIPADQFIPVAEETGLIVPMGNFVLHRTLQTMSAWQRAGVKLVPVSLNVAPGAAAAR